MKKFGFILACVAVLCALPVSLKAGNFSFNVLFDATSLFCRPCVPCYPPPCVERRVIVASPIPYYYYGVPVVREYHPYGCCERRVIVHRPCPPPCYYPY